MMRSKALIPALVVWLMVVGVACSRETPEDSGLTAPSAVLDAKPGSRNKSITTTIEDEAGGLPADISSDGLGAYNDGVSGLTSFLTTNGFNGIEFGDWQFNTNNSTGRSIGHRFDAEDAIQFGEPNYTAPANPPFWGSQNLTGNLQVMCTLLNRNMLTMTAGSSFTCPLLNNFKTANGNTYGLNPAYSFTGFPETTDARIVCNQADPDGCNDWFIEPIGPGPAVARLNLKATKPNRPPTNLGDYYLRFRIHLTRP